VLCFLEIRAHWIGIGKGRDLPLAVSDYILSLIKCCRVPDIYLNCCMLGQYGIMEMTSHIKLYLVAKSCCCILNYYLVFSIMLSFSVIPVVCCLLCFLSVLHTSSTTLYTRIQNAQSSCITKLDDNVLTG
jgi:hypothetical protein